MTGIEKKHLYMLNIIIATIYLVLDDIFIQKIILGFMQVIL